VERALLLTENLTDIRPETLQANPSVLPMLRMATCPPIARDGVKTLEFRLKKRERQPRRSVGYRKGENEGEKENP
jgi:hypothetical protein